MKEQIADYVISLYRDIPMAVYEGLLSVLCLGVVVIIACYGFKRGWRRIAGLVLVEYVVVILCSTVFFRQEAESQNYNFTPFWSYSAIQEGRTELLPENIMNVVVFIPVGLLMGFMVNGSWLKVKRAWLIVLMTGLVISVSIEAMQYFFHKGFSETDDVMHNTLGCMIGYGVYAVARYGWLMKKLC